MSTIDFNNGDDLSDLLGGETTAGPRVLPQDPGLARIRAEKTGVVESCPKCRGTGQFVSYSGRLLGQCYACKGAGSKTYVNSAPVRAANRQKDQDRRVAQMTNRLEHYQGKGPVEAARVEWILRKRDSFGFAGAMLETLHKFGDLTKAQYEAVDRCMLRDAPRAPVQAAPAAPVVDVSNIVDCFQRAQEAGLKRFKLRFTGVFFEQDKHDPSKIWVSEAGYGSAKYGLIEKGVYKVGRAVTAQVLALIVEVAKDPLAAGIAYAQVTASCSVCGRHLENQDSVDAGMGPVCAGRINRPGLKFVAVKEGDF